MLNKGPGTAAKPADLSGGAVIRVRVSHRTGRISVFNRWNSLCDLFYSNFHVRIWDCWDPAERRRLTLSPFPDPTGLHTPDSTWTSDPPRLSACPFYRRPRVFLSSGTWHRVWSGLTADVSERKQLLHETFLFIRNVCRRTSTINQDGANFIPTELLWTVLLFWDTSEDT